MKNREFRILDEKELVNEIKLEEYFNEDNVSMDWELNRVAVYDGDTELDTLYFDDLKPDFLVVKGNLTIHDSLEILGMNDDGEGISGALILGDLKCKSLRLLCGDIVVTGDLKVEQYIISAIPDYEQGTLVVKGKCSVPYVFQMDLNPMLEIRPEPDTIFRTTDSFIDEDYVNDEYGIDAERYFNYLEANKPTFNSVSHYVSIDDKREFVIKVGKTMIEGFSTVATGYTTGYLWEFDSVEECQESARKNIERKIQEGFLKK